MREHSRDEEGHGGPRVNRTGVHDVKPPKIQEGSLKSLGAVACTCNPNSGEVEAGVFLG